MASFLQLIPYPIFPPRNGGALRCCNLLQQLSLRHRGCAVIYQDATQLSGLEREVRDGTTIRSTGDGPWKSPRVKGGRVAGLRYRWLTRSLRGPAERFVLDAYPTLRDIQRSGPAPDFIVFEGVGTLALAPMLRRWASRSVFVLDAHNVDHVLMQKEMNAAADRGEPIRRQTHRLFSATSRREQNLARFVDGFFACSEQDRDRLQDLNPSVRGYVVPNGVDCDRFPFRSLEERPARRNVLFCGSLNYPANHDGLEWFGTHVWPAVRKRIEGVTFTIVGRGGSRKRCGDWLSGDDIQWVGEVEDVLPYYHEASVAICPLRMGSGTRLKILEALSSGTPMVSTTVGAEGLLETCSDALTIADSAAQFGDTVCRVLSNRPIADQLSRAGRQIALSEFDWNVVGKAMDGAMKQMLESKVLGTRNVT